MSKVYEVKFKLNLDDSLNVYTILAESFQEIRKRYGIFVDAKFVNVKEINKREE